MSEKTANGQSGGVNISGSVAPSEVTSSVAIRSLGSLQPPHLMTRCAP